VIDIVGDHPLLEAGGRPTSLAALTGGRLAVVAFIYTTCVETTGCPMSDAVLTRVDRTIADDPALRGRVTLVSVSFDPERDTPARMAAVRAHHAPQSDWRFVTTSGEAELAPLLADFDQHVARLRFPDGAWTGLYRHVLKVFLLDEQRRVRNVYSTGFLNAALVINDLRTLAAESPPRRWAVRRPSGTGARRGRYTANRKCTMSPSAPRTPCPRAGASPPRDTWPRSRDAGSRPRA
jgi:cytochrome c peroxidase